jgi:hypothetical protein
MKKNRLLQRIVMVKVFHITVGQEVILKNDEG